MFIVYNADQCPNVMSGIFNNAVRNVFLGSIGSISRAAMLKREQTLLNGDDDIYNLLYAFHDEIVKS